MAIYTGKKLTPAERKEKEAKLGTLRACSWEAMSQISFGSKVVIEDRIEGTEERCWIYKEPVRVKCYGICSYIYRFVHVDGGRYKIIKEKDQHKYFIAPLDAAGNTAKGWDPNDEH